MTTSRKDITAGQGETLAQSLDGRNLIEAD